MPALPNVPGVFKVKFGHTVGADTTTGTHMFVRYTGAPPDNTAALSIAGTCEAAWTAGVTLSQVPAQVLTSVEVTDLSSPSGGFAHKIVNHPGTAGGTAVPAQVTALARCTVQRRYRGGKPRMYIPMGAITDMSDAQHWSTAALANFNSHWQATIGQVIAATWTGGNATGLCSVSYYQGATWAQNPVTLAWKRFPTLRSSPVIDTITSTSIESLTGTQRRRVRGRLS